MADRLIDFLDGREPQGFESRPIYCRDGDFITLHLCDGDYYAERVDELLTVYLSPENNSLVGCKIKGARKLLQTLGEFGVSVENGEVSLNLLFMAGAVVSPMKGDRYRQIGSQAPNLRIPSELLTLQMT